MRTSSISIILYTLTGASHALYSGKYCPLACETGVNYVTFNDTDPSLSSKIRGCQSELRVTSLYLCFDEFCIQDSQTEKWIENQNPWCEAHANITLPSFRDILDQWTPDDKARVTRLSAEKALRFPTIDEVVIPSDELVRRAFTTMVRFRLYGQRDYGVLNVAYRKRHSGNTRSISCMGKSSLYPVRRDIANIIPTAGTCTTSGS